MKEEPSSFSVRAMRRSLALARKGKRAVCPNPQVGAIITNSNKIISTGFHKKAGEVHAEVDAINKLKTVPENSTLYVTLEPCNHQGKTPPCTDAIIKSGIKKVVVAVKDPNSNVRGGGIEKLRANGVEVEIGCLAEKASDLLSAWIFWLNNKRPYVYSLLCLSLDGKIIDPLSLQKDDKDFQYYFEKRKDRFDLIVDSINFDETLAKGLLKFGGKNIQSLLSLGIELNKKLFLANLVNEFVIFHFPIILGQTGKTFLDGVDSSKEGKLELISTKRFRKIVISRFLLG